jgi:hypothetical protein
VRFTRGPRPQEHDPKEEGLREKLERVKGIEPSYSAWKAAALPLSYTREALCHKTPATGTVACLALRMEPNL